ncbi:MMPL family transporter [Rhodococcus sp. NPDC003318]|uniref:MMPL family transporter n=1 Tax=Rhodococcus sp. NPDC003318 TaxID=3364503 RepID=UPI0036B98714
MATYLYRIGKFAYRRKGTVLSIWLALLVLMGVGAATLSGPTNDSFSIPGTPAQKAQDLMAERFPSDGRDPFNSISARFVFAAPEGQTLDTPENQAAMDETLAAVRAIDLVEPAAKVDPATATPDESSAALVNPVVADAGLTQMVTAQAEQTGKPLDQALADAAALSPLGADKTVGYVEVPFTGDYTSVTPELIDEIDAAAQAARDAGLTVEVSGTAAQAQEAPGGSAELIGMAVAAVVLVLTFGSLVAAGLPLLSAIIGVGIGSLGITIATGFTELGSMTPTLAVMIGLAVAIDYSLFIVSRFRHEVNVTGNREEAAGRAVGTAGSAVVFAGLTVIIALVALRVVGIKFLSDMGLAAAFAVLIAVLVALTFLPAFLGLLGRKAFAGRIPFVKATDPEADDAAPGPAARYATWVARKPAIPLIAGVVILGALALPATGLKLALPSESTGDPATSSRQAYDLVSEGFGPGRNSPLIVVVDAKDASVPAQQAFGRVVQTISEQDDVVNAQVVGVNPAGDTAQILVTPGSAPTDERTVDLMQSIRDSEGTLHDEIGVNYGVTGQTALETDISDTLLGALVPYLTIVVGLAFILLMLVFRSILVPLTAALGFLLSVAATFGATVAIFQHGWGGFIANPQPLVSFMPIFLIGVVFGLAMDYQVFLVTRMREEYVHGASAKEAMTIGFRHGARVVTAAALIMMSVFGAFMLEGNAFIKSIGFALAAAVFFDAFIVRMVIIPAVMAVLGDKAWWLPKWLDKILPNVDIEGEKLRKELPQSEAAPEPAPSH